ncbi:protein unc-13 homolog B-like isoform X12 [Elysia marginata]|uniref:Protein unc-13 homolog B-like isoform X12 n=1 Tax=Elysia marginata TaxID=1093978 RepID=A0AAV4FMB4_9GAST|nr:protein unc-13 homolog B-like isoform X12 [Elysia marginata]
MRLDTGLIIEVWNKGMLWDKLLGLHWLPLIKVQHSNKEGKGKWLPLDSELVINNGEVVGTRLATEHRILIDARFELPYGERVRAGARTDLPSCPLPPPQPPPPSSSPSTLLLHSSAIAGTTTALNDNWLQGSNFHAALTLKVTRRDLRDDDTCNTLISVSTESKEV